MVPFIYVGESSRSLRERAKENHRDYAKKEEDSQILKHWARAHPDVYVIGAYKSCLDGRIRERCRSR